MKLDLDQYGFLVLMPDGPNEATILKALFHNYLKYNRKSLTMASESPGGLDKTDAMYFLVGPAAESNIMALMMARPDAVFQIHLRGENRDN